MRCTEGNLQGAGVGAPGALDLIILRACSLRAKWKMELRERESGVSLEGGFHVLVTRLRERAGKGRFPEQRLILWVGGEGNQLDSQKAPPVFHSV